MSAMDLINAMNAEENPQTPAPTVAETEEFDHEGFERALDLMATLQTDPDLLNALTLLENTYSEVNKAITKLESSDLTPVEYGEVIGRVNGAMSAAGIPDRIEVLAYSSEEAGNKEKMSTKLKKLAIKALSILKRVVNAITGAFKKFVRKHASVAAFVVKGSAKLSKEIKKAKTLPSGIEVKLAAIVFNAPEQNSPFDDTMLVSALSGFNVSGLKETVAKTGLMRNLSGATSLRDKTLIQTGLIVEQLYSGYSRFESDGYDYITPSIVGNRSFGFTVNEEGEVTSEFTGKTGIIGKTRDEVEMDLAFLQSKLAETLDAVPPAINKMVDSVSSVMDFMHAESGKVKVEFAGDEDEVAVFKVMSKSITLVDFYQSNLYKLAIEYIKEAHRVGKLYMEHANKKD